jgi:hypothetical protein
MVKSGTGGGGVLLPPPPPQPVRLTVAARRTTTEASRTKEKLQSEDDEPNITRPNDLRYRSHVAVEREGNLVAFTFAA